MKKRVKRDYQKLGIYGLSCDCLPGYSRDQLARLVEYPNPKLRESTVGRVRNAGFEIFPAPTRRSRAHATLKLPDPLTEQDWERLEEIFDEPVDNIASLERGEEQ